MSQFSTSNRSIGVLAILMNYWGFTVALNSASAPFLATEFGLDDVGIARTFGWIAIGVVGTYALARAADRLGRRRILSTSLLAMAPLALCTALTPNLLIFVMVQIGAHALISVMGVLVPVMVTEALPIDRRARGQGIVGLCGALGSGGAFILVAACANVPGTWRWGWAAAVLGMALLPLVRRALPESAQFTQAFEAGQTARAHGRELLGTFYRQRTLAMVAIAAIAPIAIASSQAWLIYFPVQHLGLNPFMATAVVIIAGIAGLAGFPVGGRLCETWGRRPTFATSAILFTIATIAFYNVPADLRPHPAAGLGLAYCGMGFAGSMLIVPMRAAGTELFPTTLRATVSGWGAIAAAGGGVISFFATSVLTDLLGGLAPAVSLLSLCMIIATLIFLLAVPESRGLELEAEPGEKEIPGCNIRAACIRRNQTKIELIL